eukprot:1195893-Prorocentrum_minimum.AAC.3
MHERRWRGDLSVKSRRPVERGWRGGPARTCMMHEGDVLKSAYESLILMAETDPFPSARSIEEPLCSVSSSSVCAASQPVVCNTVSATLS